MINKLLTLLNPTASPQTGVSDGDSRIIQVGPLDTNRGGAAGLFNIVFSGDWTAGTATLTPSFCLHPAESPQRWVAVSKLKDDGTDAAITRTADFNLTLTLPAGSQVKWALAATGSPLPAIAVSLTARGVIRAV